ncbi:hypothetical protein [Paracoccus tibetensis]|uniref:DUF3168 domain-containing protein n=1 Tax=Paracoccus tibetensis TaxID=336292 RepID=A0A1G5HD16_9RHOB|nr:hypothetical protein [Paracoccus tibetensis]SCY61571.1 hypothetical protein SAMN05660710_02109 [Paracoccus tibetensis]
MPHYRSTYRAVVRAALAATPALAGITVLRVWPGSIDAAALPILGVLTPQEPSVLDSQNSSERRTLLQVALRREGGEDIEDRLDEDSAVIEALVLAALRSPEIGVALEETTIVSHSQSRAYVGTLVMSFRVLSWQPASIFS